MKDFFIYFFGAGTEVEFSLFTPAHFAPVLLALAVILLIRQAGSMRRICATCFASRC